jgi:hypothetical protein
MARHTGHEYQGRTRQAAAAQLAHLAPGFARSGQELAVEVRGEDQLAEPASTARVTVRAWRPHKSFHGWVLRFTKRPPYNAASPGG